MTVMVVSKVQGDPVHFEQLSIGDWFLYHGDTCIKVNCSFRAENAFAVNKRLLFTLDCLSPITRVRKSKLEIEL